MMKKQLIAVSLACSAFGSAIAENYNAPLVSVRGPLRYDLNLKQDKWSLSTWSTVHSRGADRSFWCHGTEASTLPTAIFGKETFTINESFEQNDILKTGLFTNQNPFFFLTKFTPSASYTDEGITIGGRLECPVFNNKGRVGLRASLPFKTVRMERDDAQGECPQDGLDSVAIHGDQARMVDASGQSNAKVFSGINRYKLAFLNQVKTIVSSGAVKPILFLSDGTGGSPANQSGFFGPQYKFPISTQGGIANTTSPQGYDGTDVPFVIIRGSGVDGYSLPFGAPSAVTVLATSGNFAATANTSRVVYGPVNQNLTAPALNTATPAASDLLSLKPDLSNVTAANQNKGFAFTSGTDYTNIATQPNFETLWVTPVFDGATGQMPQVALNAVNLIEGYLKRFQQGAACALADLGFAFDTYERKGLGDLDVDAFYEHTFNDNWRSEVWFGVRFPTGGSNKFCENPFRIQLGNGNHFEVNIGGLLAWQTPCNWLALKTDVSYAWVLSADEQRAATFKGATVKNIGPCACASVDWGYFTGHFDFNFYHTKSRKLGTMIGYEIYCKSKDNVCYKDKKSKKHFLGQVWSDQNGNPLGAAQPAAGTVPQYSDYYMALDNKTAEKNTDRIAHRVRTECHWHAHKYWSLYAGGAYTFAGKHIFLESDVHGGINVRY